MIVGTTMFYLDGASLHSPEFPRGGLAATFAVDVLQYNVGGASQFDIDVEHRNSDETSFASAGSFTGITAAGVASKDLSSLKEIIRLRFTFTGGTPAADDAVHFLVQAPSWRPY